MDDRLRGEEGVCVRAPEEGGEQRPLRNAARRFAPLPQRHGAEEERQEYSHWDGRRHREARESERARFVL